MKTRDELLNPTSCLNRSQADEPIFVLCARDAVAAHVVEYWASAYILHKQDHATDGQLTAKQHAKVEEARQLAKEMREWKRAHSMQQRRTADTVSPVGAPPVSVEVTVTRQVSGSETPVAWIRGHKVGTYIEGVYDYDEEVVAGTQRPKGDNWVPLYARPGK